jgi:hypothetical protein
MKEQAVDPPTDFWLAVGIVHHRVPPPLHCLIQGALSEENPRLLAQQTGLPLTTTITVTRRIRRTVRLLLQ